MKQAELNTIYNEDCLEGMAKMAEGTVDLTVTSPPYDNLRSYNGNNELWNETVWKSVIKDLYRVTKDGGVVVWVVGDKTHNMSESGTSFRQALYAMEIGFKLYDTMIYAKNQPVPLTHRRYEQQFEYMFVWSKGKPNTFNPKMKRNKQAGKEKGGTIREANGKMRKKNKIGRVKDYSIENNIWFYDVGKNKSTKDAIAYKHPAIFPEKLAEDHILSWSNEGDIVLDPFVGSGTTAIACLETNRNFIGFELDEEYHGVATERIEKHKEELEE